MDATFVAAAATVAVFVVICHRSSCVYLNAIFPAVGRKVPGLFTAGWHGKILHASQIDL